MHRIISVLLFCISTTLVIAQPTTPLVLADGAPERYTVVRGDTLWGLSAKYLKDPYLWPALWKMNVQEIKNPHWIYPGQVLVLDRNGREPRLTFATEKTEKTEKLSPREYIEPTNKAIPSIPPQDIEPFLSQPLVVDQASMAGALRVVGLQDNRVIAGAGDMIYTTSAANGATASTWQVFRAGKPLNDPETKEALGFEALYVGTARLTAQGEVTSFRLLTTKEEVLAGDLLLPAPRVDVVSYIPHAPEQAIKARVLSIYGGVQYGGPQAVVVLNRGKKDGLEAGHVLAIDAAGVMLDDRFQGEKKTYTLPDARNGLVFVFRVFDRVAYALVMSAQKPVVVGDAAHTP
ncbi:MAG: LysM domain-containing protein [Pseudomonadota bacterium]